MNRTKASELWPIVKAYGDGMQSKLSLIMFGKM